LLNQWNNKEEQKGRRDIGENLSNGSIRCKKAERTAKNDCSWFSNNWCGFLSGSLEFGTQAMVEFDGLMG
jgi:hypothetical protein